MRARKDGEVTREKIIEAACQVFGEKGYAKATHAEICRRAGVNTALINFHFGSKDDLYRSVWAQVFTDVERAYPVEDGVPADAPAEERLRGRVHALISRALDPQLEGFHRMRTVEFLNPTGLIDEDLSQRMQRLRIKLQEILRELLGPAVTNQALELCELSLHSQCHMIIPPLHVKRRHPHRFTHADIARLTEHITRFSLAGIRAVRDAYEAQHPAAITP